MQYSTNSPNLLDVSQLIYEFSMCRAGGDVRVAYPERPYMLSWGAVLTEACNNMLNG